MINEKIEGFLEKVNMNYLFCLLSNLEAQRINQFPSHVKQKFDKKITSLAMEHVADNDVPDYLAELAEAEMLAKSARAAFEDNDETGDFDEETVDDSINFARNIEDDEVMDTETYTEEKVEDPFAMVDDDEMDDDFDDEDDDDL